MIKKLAIIGTGIAGMGCAHKLQSHFDLSLYERNDYVGGHTNTVTVDEEGTAIPIDTGFMVYNEITYPHLTQLFSELDVETKPTKMSFSVQHIQSGLELAGTGFSGLFSQRKNLFKPNFFKFLLEIDRFNKNCGEILRDSDLQKLSLSDYCDLRGYSKDFQLKYLVPMSAAVWSSPPDRMLDFPAFTLVRFFTNHRFLGLTGQLQWRTVVGGSQKYRDKLTSPFKHKISVKNAAIRVRQLESSVEVEDQNGVSKNFDGVVIATHADEALSLLANPDPLQSKLLDKFKYQQNQAILHTDDTVMPKAARAWTSWNYRVDPKGPSTIYWMNSLQGVSQKQNYFVSINDPGNIDPHKIIRTIDYKHPLYTLESVAAQAHLAQLNQKGAIFFCGSYFNYGFHEDALTSGYDAAKAVISRYERGAM